MIDVVWAILRQNNRFLLAQRSIDNTASETWVFPGGRLDPEDITLVEGAVRELKEEVGLNGEQFKLLCKFPLDKYLIHVFCCHKWSGELRPACKDIIGVGWFTLAEMYSLGPSLAPFVDDSLLYLAYLIQHYDNHPTEWKM